MKDAKEKMQNEDVAIELNSVSMKYIGSDEKIDSIKEYFIKKVKGKVELNRFVALEDVNLIIRKGDRVGLIGHNGAGKSTLLKLISGVMKPTSGKIIVRGSIAPMLELGAGFDYDFTGRENIYFNGAILGKSQSYIKEKEEEIVKFAALGSFIDSPVKNYSSGMRAKLGFSIITNLDAEIIIIDEVLSVGDISFKKKSEEKIKALIYSGKTILLVSHSLEQIKNLTDYVVWIDNGRIKEVGPSEIVCEKYKKYMLNGADIKFDGRKERIYKVGKFNKLIKDKLLYKIILEDEYLRNRFLSIDKICEELKGNSKKTVDLLSKLKEDSDSVYNGDVLLLGDSGQLEKAVENNIKFKNEIVEILANNRAIQKEIEKKADEIEKAKREAIEVDSVSYYEEFGVLVAEGNIAADYEGRVAINSDGQIVNRELPIRKNEFFYKGETKRFNWIIIERMAEFAKVTLDFFCEGVASNHEEVKLEQVLKSSISVHMDGEKNTIVSNFFKDHFMSGANTYSYSFKNSWVSRLERDRFLGYRIKAASCGDEEGLFLANQLGMRGPDDVRAENVVFGDSQVMSINCKPGENWFDDKIFDANWLNMGFATSIKAITSRFESCYQGNYGHAVFVYTPRFYTDNLQYEDLYGNVDRIFRNFKYSEEITTDEEFSQFLIDLCKGVIEIYNTESGLVLVRTTYGVLDFEKLELKFKSALEDLKVLLGRFNSIDVIEIPLKEDLFESLETDKFMKIRENHEKGAALLRDALASMSSKVRFSKLELELDDYQRADVYLSSKGQAKLKVKMKESLKSL